MDERSHSLDKPASVLVGAGFVGAILAFLTMSCCVLPMALMLVGLGGAWMVVFSPIVAASVYILPLAVLCLVAAWVVALRRQASRRVFVLLIIASVMSGVAGLIYVFQTQLNDYLISLM